MAAWRPLLFLPVLTACGATPEEVAPATAAPVTLPEPVPEAPPPAAEQPTPLQRALDLLADGQEARGLTGLREEMATGDQPLDAALELAAYLADRERLREALASIDAGLVRVPEHPRLLRARASLLRDLAQREPALQVLRNFVAKDDSDPSMWLQIAELEWLQGRRESALQALQHLRSSFEDHPFVQQYRAGISNLEQEIATNPAPRTISQRDLLANLRGAEEGMMRFRALRLLVEEGGDLRRRATTIALYDPDPALRVQGLKMGDWTVAEAERLIRRAVIDDAASVRAAALTLCDIIDRRIAAPIVFAALERETDPDTFRLMHEELQGILEQSVYLPPGAADHAEGRAGVVARWRALL